MAQGNPYDLLAPNRRFSEWSVRLVWSRGAPSWAARRVDPALIEELKGRPDVYWSIGSYTDEAIGLRSEQVAQLDSVLPFLVDIDGHDSRVTLKTLVRATVKTTGWLSQVLGIPPQLILVWFSGRGFHVEVPADLIQSHAQPSTAHRHERLAAYLLRQLDVYADVSESDGANGFVIRRLPLIDLSLYCANKLIRVPFTINSRSRFMPHFPKVRVPWSVMLGLSVKDDARQVVESFRLFCHRHEGWHERRPSASASGDTIGKFADALDQVDDTWFPVMPLAEPVGWANVKAPRPCIESMRATVGIPEGSRNNRLYRIAVELRRRGWSGEMVTNECLRVNRTSFASALKEGEVQSTAASAFKRDAVSPCQDSLLQEYCVGQESCSWLAMLRAGMSGRPAGSEETFENNWLSLLSPAAREVYVKIRILEARQGCGPGGVLQVSMRQIAAELSHRDKGIARRALQRLADEGLIKIHSLGVGGSASATGFATRVSRTVPIPMPGSRGG